MAGLTPEMARKYLKQKGLYCPFCGSNNPEGGPVETGNEEATQEMYCLDCHEAWMDAYKLVGIYDGNGEWVEPTPEQGEVNMAKKVYIHVSGGVVDEVCGPTGLTAVIIDEDNGECDGNTEASNKELQAELDAAKAAGTVGQLDQN